MIGGSKLYRQALDQNLVDEMILTEIHHDFEGDASFPDWDDMRFIEVGRTVNPASAERTWGFDFVKYARVNVATNTAI